ncbi:MAG: hypothetical protein B7Y95_06685 [Rhizobiales bacterium 32-66-11]|nr:MAG: hypothetical protein B7Y95_06685 [Rhizobiales bacterium 32-66-11]
MCVGGQSLLLIAATQNRAIIIDYIVAIGIGNAALCNSLFFQFVEAARESCQRGYFVTGLMLICNCSIHDPLWESVYGIAVKAPNVSLRHWAHTTRASFDAHQLVTSGVYAQVRHPMYSAFFLWAVAQALLLPNLLAGFSGLVGFGILFFFRVGQEEAMMRETFGAQYEAYCARTKRIIPGLY